MTHKTMPSKHLMICLRLGNWAAILLISGLLISCLSLKDPEGIICTKPADCWSGYDCKKKENPFTENARFCVPSKNTPPKNNNENTGNRNNNSDNDNENAGNNDNDNENTTEPECERRTDCTLPNTFCCSDGTCALTRLDCPN